MLSLITASILAQPPIYGFFGYFYHLSVLTDLLIPRALLSQINPEYSGFIGFKFSLISQVR